MEDMKKLWEFGVTIWDEYNKQHLNLKAIIFYTINDNPACLSLTGQVKGKAACVVCVDQIESIYLPSSSKLVYMWHHVNTSINNGKHGSMVRSKMNRHLTIEMANFCLK
jgi:hypothetical protein